MFQFSPPTRFGEAYRPELEASQGLRVVAGATVVDVTPSKDGTAVTGCDVASLGGASFRVEPDVVVLATGGIEVARQLLVFGRRSGAPFGNAHDLVGRTFMEHPHIAVGRVALAAPEAALWLSHHGPAGVPAAPDAPVWAGLAAAEAVVEERGLRNAAITLEFVPPEARAEPAGRRVGIRAVQRLLGGDAGTAAVAKAVMRAEQAPNPASRVTLAPTADALGVPRAALDWQIADDDRRSWRATAMVVADALGRTGAGRMEVPPEGAPAWATPECGNHHMGTAAMHEDPRAGVVDADCRVHGMRNLYVAGSAVFPTGGFANPTLTVVALAHRLADHLAGRVLPT
jgi:choline dehydrogenase-like flavoprotein